MASDKGSIRSKFVAALQDGKTTDEATAIANGTKSPARDKADLAPPSDKLKDKAQDAAKPGKQPEKAAKGEKAAKPGK